MEILKDLIKPLKYCEDVKIDEGQLYIKTDNHWNLIGDSVDNKITLSDDLIQEIGRKLSIKPTVEHKCHNCGGTVELDNEKHIFHCPYCNSIYAIGYQQIRSVY